MYIYNLLLDQYCSLFFLLKTHFVFKLLLDFIFPQALFDNLLFVVEFFRRGLCFLLSHSFVMFHPPRSEFRRWKLSYLNMVIHTRILRIQIVRFTIQEGKWKHHCIQSPDYIYFSIPHYISVFLDAFSSGPSDIIMCLKPCRRLKVRSLFSPNSLRVRLGDRNHLIGACTTTPERLKLIMIDRSNQIIF